jgi:hypothetical protein
MPWLHHSFRRNIFDSLDAISLVQELKTNASIITIAREPDYCGSIGNSNKILQMVDNYFFDGALGASPIQ